MRKFISIFLIMAILVGIVGTYPITATANEDVTVPDGIFTTAELAEITATQQVSTEQTTAGVKVTYNNPAYKWARVGVQDKSKLDGKGVRIEVTDIAYASGDYAFSLYFGNDRSVFFDRRGYALIYENDGKFSIVATKGSGTPQASPKVNDIDGVQLEPLNGNLTIDIKIVGDNYVIVVNGHPFRIPNLYTGSEYQLSTLDELAFSFAFVNTSHAADLFPGATYTIKSITPITYFTEAELAEITATQQVSTEQTDAGVKVTYNNPAYKWARVGVQDKYKIDENGVHIEITDIKYASGDYAFSMYFGNDRSTFFDRRGYALIYENNGKFSIVATKGSGTPQASPKVIDGVQLDALTGKLSIDIKLVGDNYVIVVNGNSYTIPTLYKESSYQLYTTNELLFSFAFVNTSHAADLFPSATYTIKSITPITYNVDKVTLDSSSKTMIVDEESSLTASVVGENLSNTAVTWASSDTNIATVDVDGNVTAHLSGTVSITATSVADTTKSAACEVKVTEEEVSQEIFTLAKLAEITTTQQVSTEQTDAGVKVTYNNPAYKWARVGVQDKSKLDGKGVRIEVTDIAYASGDYAFSLYFGNDRSVFFDRRGYALIYENDGKFSIVATKGSGTPQASPKVNDIDGVQLEPLNGNLTIDIKMVGDNYVIVVNGHPFRIPKLYTDSSYQLATLDELAFSFAFVNTSHAADLFPGATYTIKSITPITDTELQQPMKAIAYTSTFHNFRNETEMEVPIAPEGYVFAGWYSDAACEATPISPGVKVLEAGAKVYARFVPETVLSVKPQAKYSKTENDETDTNKIDLRFVTTVDSFNYQSVGFEVTNRAGVSTKYPQQYVFESLVAAGVEYGPTYFNQLSIRFATINMTGVTVEGEGISSEREIPVRAYWITKDGTTVYGPERLVKISDAVASLQGNAN